jgi:putative DNA primase/helicase
MYQNHFTFSPTHKCVLMTNYLPQIRGTDEGIWRRLALVEFGISIPTGEQDHQLMQGLRGELPGILAWCVQGCLQWREQGLNPPAEVLAAIGQHRREQDVIGQWLEERCLIQEERQARSSDLFADYKSWCQTAECAAVSQKLWGGRMKSAFKSKTSNGVIYQGIGLR